MRTKEDVLSIWNDYIDVYKHIRDNIGNWLNTKYPLPFNELWNIFGDTLDGDIRAQYNQWVQSERRRLYSIADKNGLSLYIDDDYCEILLREMTHGVSLKGFIPAMGQWCVRGELGSYLPKSKRVDEVDFEEILDRKFDEQDYDKLYKDITDSIDLLHFRLKDEAISKTVDEINKLVDGMTDDCAKFMEDVSKSKFNEVIHLLEDLKGDARYDEGVALVYNFLAGGDFNRWYYGVINGKRNLGASIDGYIEALKNTERLD